MDIEDAKLKMKAKTLKQRIDLIEPDFILKIGEVLTYGTQKYAENSWKEIDHPESAYFSACMRHMLKWKSGEENDSETGINHLIHAATNIMFLFHFKKEINCDDRYNLSQKQEWRKET